MSQNPAATHHAEDRHDATRSTFERRLALLVWLTEIGRTCVRVAARGAATGKTGVEIARAAHTFDRMSRAVRLTIALARHTWEMFQAWRLAPDAQPEMDEPHTAEADAETRAAGAEARPEFENLRDYESYDEFSRLLLCKPEDEFARILKKPFEEIIALICKDLGLKFDREAWTSGAEPEDVLEAKETEVGLQRRRVGPSDKYAEDAEKRGPSAEAHRAEAEEECERESSSGP